ncbi:integrating conjugative element protein [Thioalkalivibrio denitrificans]|uniref:Integrating conjugative element protein n=1 Tax=Thioalkalivibrio denitrificans TaxID=108003 RepID=A0A1V3NUW5_9GAMM|nr:integrating conjugative element protein [Thioalkalivibrio denitrificans]OOG28821.1 integrating conjugative element protein [Thioalkalivibrio denitrificans]
MYHRTFKALGVAVAVSLLAVAPGAGAQAPGTLAESLFYYEIGGGRPVSRAPNPQASSTTFGVTGVLGLGYSCGRFDPITSVTNQMQNLGDEYLNQIEAAATAAIAALPLLILQRANPGLYDLFQNALLRAEETVQLATKSCEQMEAEILAGRNPFHEWMVLSRGNDWRLVMGTGERDVVRARDTVESNAGTNGIPWVFGDHRGGQNMPPLEPVSDLVHAAYNVIADRPPAATGTAFTGAASDPPIAVHWTSPEQASEWAREVLGDLSLATCTAPGCPGQETTTGTGLPPKVEETSEDIRPILEQLVSGAIRSTPENLTSVSSANIVITADTVRAIAELGPAERHIVIARVADEVALAINIEKALYVRRLLLVGRQLPEAAAAGDLSDEIVMQKIAELEREIDNTLFEVRVSREISAPTLLKSLEHSTRIQDRSRRIHSAPPSDARPTTDGTVAR